MVINRLQMKKKGVLSVFDICLIIGIGVTNILYSVFSGTVDILGSMTGIAGVLCVVLVAKGSIWNYLFGLVNVSLYAWISFKTGLYGDAALNALYYVPMQFIGWWQWRKRGASPTRGEDGQASVVHARRMTPKQLVLLGTVCVAGIVLGAFVLEKLGDPQPWKDSVTTVLSIIAQFLMAMAFMEQWALWIITNVVSVIMWSVCVANGDPHSELMVIMWLFYLANSVNGFRVWLRLSKS